jgi:hypothetical protein
MKADIRITAQYYENYSDNDTPYWKPKGGTEFIIKGVDPNPVMFAAPGEVEKAIENLLYEHSNSHAKYTLIDWEFIFSEPIELDKDNFLWEMGIDEHPGPGPGMFINEDDEEWKK